jgi:hypothetical protein
VISDVLASWLDLATFPFILLSGGPLPEVHFDIDRNALPPGNRATKAIAVTFPSDLQIVNTDLLRKDQVASRFLRGANVTATLFDDGNVLLVELLDLNNVNLVAGVYTGDVKDARTGEPVATISVTVK